MHIKKNMIKNDEGFTCLRCKIDVDPHPDGSSRNHCPYCLYSLHVDSEVPGDRESECQGLMVPIGIELNKKKGTRIEHMCQKCGHRIYNKIASDDNWDLICELSRIPKEDLT